MFVQSLAARYRYQKAQARGGAEAAAAQRHAPHPLCFALRTQARLSLVVRACFRERLHKDVARDRRRRKEGETAFGPLSTPPASLACLCCAALGLRSVVKMALLVRCV